MAARHEIFPAGRTPARTRDYVVQGQLTGRQHRGAILAGIAVAQQDIFPRESATLMRNATILEQADDGWQPHGYARRMEKMAVLFLGHGDALEDQHQGA